MEHIKKIFTRPVRGWIYGVTLAFIPLAVHLGWMSVEASVLVLPLIMAILNLTPKADKQEGQGDGTL